MTISQPVAVPTAASAAAPGAHARIAPIAPERFALQMTIPQATRDKLRRAQELLGHAVPSNDIAQVLDRALDALIAQLEKRKCAAVSTERAASPRKSPRRPKRNPRQVPAAVRRAVWQRDMGQCTFVSENGRRCESRSDLELDHVRPVARGGEATLANLRLVCAAHNQHHAERDFGAGFMREKRQLSRSRQDSKAKPQAQPREWHSARRPLPARGS